MASDLTQPNHAAPHQPGIVLLMDCEHAGRLKPSHLLILRDWLTHHFGPVAGIHLFVPISRESKRLRPFAELGCQIHCLPNRQVSVPEILNQVLRNNLAHWPKYVAVFSGRTATASAVDVIVQNNRLPILLGRARQISKKLAFEVQRYIGQVYSVRLLQGQEDSPLVIKPVGRIPGTNGKRNATAKVSNQPTQTAESGASASSTIPSAPKVSRQPNQIARAKPARPLSSHAAGLAVFVDLENLSWLRADVLQQLLTILSDRFGLATLVRVYANTDLGRGFIQTMRGQQFHVVLVDTTRNIVDEVIMCEIANQLAQLPQTVALFTGDGDFVSTLSRIADTGRTPVVLATSKSFSPLLYRTISRARGALYLVQPERNRIVFTPVLEAPYQTPPISHSASDQASVSPHIEPTGPVYVGSQTGNHLSTQQDNPISHASSAPKLPVSNAKDWWTSHFDPKPKQLPTPYDYSPMSGPQETHQQPRPNGILSRLRQWFINWLDSL
ncbi:MAG: NYN domain-containing protein [Gemmatales bacterium]|nr:NYN domain-containing protein [Gemmatales bacterium]MDW7994369.1 NYN domain-containing protein [Gemmatales bacterium]